MAHPLGLVNTPFNRLSPIKVQPDIKENRSNVQEIQMSTYYAPIPDILFDQLFDGRLEKYGIKEEIAANPTEGTRYLAGRDGFLQVHREEKGACTFTRRGAFPWSIFDALTEEFSVELVSEDDYRYWGFATEEEWDNWNKQQHKAAENEFYNNLVKYVRDEPNSLRPGSIGMIKAKIAKTLVESDPSLVAPEKCDVLLEAVRTVYDRDHAVTITLTEQNLAAADMMAARTDDLPKA
jgi:hypothetical protein